MVNLFLLNPITLRGVFVVRVVVNTAPIILIKMKIIQKNNLIDGKLYRGYINQNFSLLNRDEQMVVGKWDQSNNYFIIDNDLKIPYLHDIDNEIEDNFMPIKEVDF